MSTLDAMDLDALSAALRQRGLDGWLVYDFHNLNPMARRLLGATGMMTRRLFLWLPAVGSPRAVVHTIDRPALRGFPGEVEAYTTWQELHRVLGALVRGRRIAMETSAENAVPYLDLVPAGVAELLTRLGATLVSSAPLVTQFAARWSAAELDDHRRAAEAIATIARTALDDAVGRIGTVTEMELQRNVIAAIEAAGLAWEEPPIVAFGAHAADPHYEPAEATDTTLAEGQVVLLDLWARTTPTTVWADQTWMAFSGSVLPAELSGAWGTVLAARDAVVARLSEATARGERVSGADLDRVARGIIESEGFGAAFGHRTGHSIEVELHGSGPHLDDFETHDVREIHEGVGFSVEPGIYVPGHFGLRSEINVYMGPGGPEVTPKTPQQAMILA